MYNLSILNDKEFEILCKDILESELKISFQNFKSGADKGIDLRSCRDQENQIVVQAKHYSRTSFSKLKLKLQKGELPSIKKLKPKPKRYILMTSLDLSVGNVDEIVKVMSPYIKTSDDVYGGTRIQQLIVKHKKIERKHFKLWLTSTSVLQRILNNAIIGKSEFEENKILRNVGKYVSTSNIKEAQKKLNRNKFIIVTGLPGIGKTTISYILIYQFLAKGYKLISIDDKIKDAEDEFSTNPEDRQIFYFDDFLGSNVLELLNQRNTQNSLINFIDRIQHSKNKFLILTTRTSILKKAEQKFEKIERAKFSEISNYEVQLSQYSLLNRAKILYNHIFHSELSQKHKDIFFRDRFYLKIIKHSNYAPRLIDYITDVKNIKVLAPSKFANFVLSSLDRPDEVWKKAYESNLELEDKFLVMTLFSLGGFKVKIDNLETAFNSRLDYEISNHGYSKQPNLFRNALKHLLDGFLVSHVENKTHYISFINPSIVDFLLSYVAENADEKWGIIKSAIYVEQLTKYFHTNRFDDSIAIQGTELQEFRDEILRIENSPRSIDPATSYQFLILEVIHVYQIHFSGNISESSIDRFIDNLNISTLSKQHIDVIVDLLRVISKHDEKKSRLESKFNDLILWLYKVARHSYQFESVKMLFEDFEFDYSIFFEENSQEVIGDFNSYFENKTYDDIYIDEQTTSIILEHLKRGDDANAKAVIEKTVMKDYEQELFLNGFDEYDSSFKSNLDLDIQSLFDSFKAVNNTEEDDFSESSFSATPKHDDEIHAIDDLFTYS